MMLLFYPGCRDGLIVEEGQRCHRLACNTCLCVHFTHKEVTPQSPWASEWVPVAGPGGTLFNQDFPQAGVQWCDHSSLKPQPSQAQVILPLQPPEQLDYSTGLVSGQQVTAGPKGTAHLTAVLPGNTGRVSCRSDFNR
nr:DNA-directed RNA polymerase III subunit RPC10 [Pan troglodytes]